MVTPNNFMKSPRGFGRLVDIEDPSEIGDDFRTHGDLRHMGHGILHEVELASLPGRSWHDGLAGCLESGVIVTRDEIDAMQSPLDQALQEIPPMRIGLTELHAAAEDGPLAVERDSDGREECAGSDCPCMTNLLVSGVEDKVSDLADGSISPGGELFVELGRGPADLGGCDLQSVELLDDGGHLPNFDSGATRTSLLSGCLICG